MMRPRRRWPLAVFLQRDIAAFPTPVLSRDGVAAVGIDPETGAHRVLRFEAP